MKVFNSSDNFSEESYASMINQLNAFMRSVGLENMQGQVINNISLPANTSVNIPHNLGVVPRYRFILRQNGGSAIIDGDSVWSETLVSLKNSDASNDAIVDIFLIRS